MEFEPCAPKVKSKSLSTLCGSPRNRLQMGWPQEPLGAELRLGYPEYKVTAVVGTRGGCSYTQRWLRVWVPWESRVPESRLGGAGDSSVSGVGLGGNPGNRGLVGQHTHGG